MRLYWIHPIICCVKQKVGALNFNEEEFFNFNEEDFWLPLYTYLQEQRNNKYGCCKAEVVFKNISGSLHWSLNGILMRECN